MNQETYVYQNNLLKPKEEIQHPCTVYGSSREVMKLSYSSGRLSRMASIWSSDKMGEPMAEREFRTCLIARM